MASGAVTIETRTGFYMVVEARVPDVPATVIGVLLADPEQDQLHTRFRRDLEQVFANDEDLEYFEHLEQHLADVAAERGALAVFDWLESEAANGVAVTDRESVLVGGWAPTLSRLYRKHVPATVQRYKTHLPVYSVAAAAGSFSGDSEPDNEPEDWIEPPANFKILPDMFVAHVVGHSMEPLIPDGCLCIFRRNPAGSRTGRHVLVEHRGYKGDNRFTIKRYRRDAKSGKVILEPLNPDFEPWELDIANEDIQVIGEYVGLVDA